MQYDFLSDLIINKIIVVTTLFSEQGAKSNRNNRHCWAIILKYEGKTVYTSKNKTYVSDINNMVILPKGCSYKWTCTEAGHYAVIEFDCDIICNDIIYFKGINGEKILKTIKELEYKHLMKQPTYKLTGIRDTYSIIIDLLNSHKRKYTPTEKVKRLEPAMEYIIKNYNNPIKNDDLAILTNLSTVYFRKLFTQVYGTSPISYIHKLRINKAKEMLKSDYSSITDIALSLGYHSIYDFSRDFKKHVGVSPNKYLKTSRK